MKINIEDLKKLREKTGAGISDCRQALEESAGNMQKAEEWLQKKALSRAEKKSEREVKAGQVFAYIHHTVRLGVMMGLACETDFVAKTEDFQTLGKDICLHIAAAKPETVEELLGQEYVKDASKTIQDLIKAVIGKLGENIQVQEFKVVTV